MMRRGTPEADLQRAVVQALRIALPRSAIIHHCANEVTEAGPRGAKRQAILVGMGVHAGFADLMVICDGRVLFLELKAPKGRLRPEQEAFRDAVLAQGFGWALVRSLDDALGALADHGFTTRIAPPLRRNPLAGAFHFPPPHSEPHPMDLVFAPSQVESWPIARLRPYARNAKMHGDDQVAKIAASMAKFGWTVPCMVADDGELIAGHGRVLAATMLGLTEVPVIRLSHLDEAERRAYRIADNKLTELGEWDEALLRDEIAGLLAEDFDLTLLGISDDDLDALLRDPEALGGDGPVEGEDDVPELPVAPVSVPGDLWQLGTHRLICGDSTAADVVGRLLGDVRPLTSATEGAIIPRLYGRMRIGGNMIWATDFREETKTTTQGGGKGGGGGKVRTTEYLYYASFAVALCEGPITGIGRIWADGKPLDMTGITWRWYPGDETQTADPFIAAKMGAANTPAYRGTAYVVFEELPLSTYGNRLPQLSFEVFRPLADPDTAEGLVKAVTMIPASGEFTYATEAVRKTVGASTTVFGQTTGGTTSAENLNALPDEADIVVALDRLQAMAPAVESVSLVVAWFGNDLRAGNCTIKPGVEVATKVTSPKVWTVNGVARANAHLVSRDAEDRPVYGGTPADFAVVQAIREMKARGLRVTFYPFLLMDVPPGNTLPNPYSANASTPGQPSFPWRGRITCSPAAGFAGTADKTAAAATQVSSFFGAATPAQFAVSGDTVSWTGPAGDWGLRRMILHYAHLCAVAGGVDAFLIGSEMRGLTTIRSSASAYPAVTAFKALAADVKTILGAGTKVGYAADWSEYFGHHPADGSGDVFFHLDPLWADANIDFIGIDNYMPLSDWRDGFDHADALEGWPAIHDRGYLQSNIAGGEGFDWFYASAADRSAQLRTPITDGAAGKPWVFRYKDPRAWWSNSHFNRPGGIESGTPTAWVPQSKPIWFTELGCPAIDRGTNQPNVFFDPKSSESFTPYFSRGWRDDAIQRAYLEASYLWWGQGANNPTSVIYGGRMVHVPECAAWTWDARPYPFFPELTGIWTDGPNWRLGHWLTGRLGAVSLAALVRHLCLRAGLAESLIDVSGLWGAVEGYVIGALESPRSQDRLAHDCEISRSTLNEHLDRLEAEQLLRRVPRIDPATKRQLPTRYILGFEEGFAPHDPEPCPETGHGIWPLGHNAETACEIAANGAFSAEPCPEIAHGNPEEPVSGFCPEPCPENAESRVRNPDTNLVREPLSKPVKQEEDAQAGDADFDRFFAELLTALGFAANATLPAWWQGWPARTHVRRWIDDIGLSRKRIIEVAFETRADHPNPPDGPKALDRFMERAAQRDAQTAFATAKGQKAKRRRKREDPPRLSDDEKAAFYAKMVNADGYLPVSAINNSIRDLMLVRGLVTPERLRLRGVR